MLVSFDGPNGAGKTTIIQKVNEELSKTYKIFITREPTNDAFGDYVKENKFSLYGLSYLFLIAANRAEHSEKELIPHMKDIILCDRYIISSLALQHAEGVSLDCIWNINKCFPQPDICFVISASAESLDSRIIKREKKSHFEKILSRQEEINLYKEAFAFASSKRNNVYWIENNEGSLSDNIRTIIDIILNIYGENQHG